MKPRSHASMRVLGVPAAALLVACVLAGGSPAFAQASSDWTQYRFDPSHAGFTPAETTLDPGNVAGLAPRWSVTLGPGGTGLGMGLTSSPTVVDGVIYQHSSYGYLYALDAATGAELWNAHTGGYGSSQPVVADGVVYVGTIYGVRAYPTACSTPCEPLWIALPEMTVNPSMTYAGGRLYVGGYDGRLYVLDAATGGTVWTADVNVDYQDLVWGPPAVASGLVFQPADVGLIVYPESCAGPDCKPVWTRHTPYSVSKSPAVVDGVVYAVDDQGELNAWDVVNGAPRWSAQTSYMPQGPVVGNGLVFVATGDGRLWAFPQDCKGNNKCAPLWRGYTGRQALFEPTVANGVVYVGALNGFYYYGTLFAFPTSCSFNCRPILSQPVDGAIETAPVVVDGAVYTGTLLGKLYKFALP